MIDYLKISKESMLYKEIRQQFVQFYAGIFANAPFFEKFSTEEVLEIFDKYTEDSSYFCCAMQENLLVGFGAGYPMKSGEESLRHILEKHFDIDKVYYNADVAVSDKYRKHGVGTRLIELRIDEAINNGFEYVVMRTSQKGSMSKHIYQKHGFSTLNETQTVKQKRINNNISETEERIILWKKIL